MKASSRKKRLSRDHSDYDSHIVSTDIDGDEDLDLLVGTDRSCFCIPYPRDDDLVWFENIDGIFTQGT